MFDAAQGVQAQTVAKPLLGIQHGALLIPIINKIDLDAADIPRAMDQVETTLELQ